MIFVENKKTEILTFRILTHLRVNISRRSQGASYGVDAEPSRRAQRSRTFHTRER